MCFKLQCRMMSFFQKQRQPGRRISGNPAVFEKTRGFPSSPCDEFGFFSVMLFFLQFSAHKQPMLQDAGRIFNLRR